MNNSSFSGLGQNWWPVGNQQRNSPGKDGLKGIHGQVPSERILAVAGPETIPYCHDISIARRGKKE